MGCKKLKRTKRLYILYEPTDDVWPLSQIILCKKLMGEPLIVHLIEALSKIHAFSEVYMLSRSDIPCIGQISDNLGVHISIDINHVRLEGESASEIVDSIEPPYDSVIIATLFGLAMRYSSLNSASSALTEPMIKYKKVGDDVILENLFVWGQFAQQFIKLVKDLASKDLHFFLGYPWNWLVFSLEILNKSIRHYVSPKADLDSSAIVKPPCYISDGARILEGAKIRGPCFIGSDVLIGNNTVVRGSIIEEKSIIGANMEVARSWLGPKTETHSGYIGDSLFDSKVHTGAGFITANVRLDRKSIKVLFKGTRIDTGLEKLGTIIGSHVEIGIHSGTMPGVLIGSNVKVGPGTILFENVEDGSTVYVKSPIVIKK